MPRNFKCIRLQTSCFLHEKLCHLCSGSVTSNCSRAHLQRKLSVTQKFGTLEPTQEEDDVITEQPEAVVLPLLEASTAKIREGAFGEKVPGVRT